MSENTLDLWSKRIDAIAGDAKSQVAAASSLEILESCRLHFLGKKGVLTEMMKELGKFPADQKAEAGKLVNMAKQTVEHLLQTTKAGFEEK
jgi:phenylalanyl-tRNA synthetase alpha chain